MAWSTILGQSFAVQMLRAHAARDRVASAYLFIGPDGVGKRLAALELAKTLNCQTGADASCGTCAVCGQIDRGAHPDVHRLTRQGNADTIRIDDVRAVLQRLALRPFQARRSVAILDGADRLTEEAANSLLKTLEETPGRATMILLTSQPANVLPTIVSRCQAVRFQRLSAATIEAWLIQHGRAPALAATVSRLAHGSLSTAAALADRWDASVSMMERLGSAEPHAWLDWDAPTDRKALGPWLSSSIWWLRDIAVAAHAAPELVYHAHVGGRIAAQAARVDRERCLKAVLRCVELWESSERLVSPRVIGALLREEWLDVVGLEAPSS